MVFYLADLISLRLDIPNNPSPIHPCTLPRFKFFLLNLDPDTAHWPCWIWNLDGLEYEIFYTSEEFDRFIGSNCRVVTSYTIPLDEKTYCANAAHTRKYQIAAADDSINTWNNFRPPSHPVQSPYSFI